MLNINPDLVCQIIDKARQFHAKEEVVIPEPPNSPADESIMQVLQDHGDDLTYQEVRDVINNLGQDQQAEIVALMWIGRDDYAIEEWESALQVANDRWNDHTAEYLLATPLVADYLMEGLGLHGYSC